MRLYQTRPQTVEAIHFDYTEDALAEVMDALHQAKQGPRQFGPLVYYDRGAERLSLLRGEVLVRDGFGHWVTMTRNRFDAKYQPLVGK